MSAKEIERRKLYYRINKEKFSVYHKQYILDNPQTEMERMRARLNCILKYNRTGYRSQLHQRQVVEDFKNYTGLLSNDPIKEAYYQSEREKIIAEYYIMESPVEGIAEPLKLIVKPKAKKINLCQRKTKQIKDDLAKLALKAEAFKAKLDAGYVVEVAHHPFE